jgi:demethylmenaquinone methyltransferase/2-methoxy-6-polyprenyl-1,4-benzoquinol methylase
MPDLSKAPARIAGMFDAIAGRYDFLNHLLSAGIDRRWRRRAVRALALTGSERVLDLCTGTGDLAIAARTASPAASHVVGVDFAAGMLGRARQKVLQHKLAGVTLVRGDATAIPLVSGSVAAITLGFGIRNVEDTAAACAEMHRVLCPGGRLAILEFGIPHAPPLRAAYLWYFNHLLPRIGRIVSRHDAAYAYLPASVGAFATPSDFMGLLEASGFSAVSAVPLTGGIVYLYSARR